MVSRFEGTRVHFVQVSVLVSRPEVQGLGIGLMTMVSRLECTRVHFVQVSVSVSRPEVQGLGLGLET